VWGHYFTKLSGFQAVLRLLQKGRPCLTVFSIGDIYALDRNTDKTAEVTMALPVMENFK